MKDRISIVLAGFTPIFCLGLQHLLQNYKEYQIVKCFSSRDEVEDFIINGGTTDILIFSELLTDITFIPKEKCIKILVFTSTPSRFKFDNWFYVGISGTIDWDCSDEIFYNTLKKMLTSENDHSGLNL